MRELFTMIPKVDELLDMEDVDSLIDDIPRKLVVDAIREELDIIREGIKNREFDIDSIKENIDGLPIRIENRINNKTRPSLRRTINCTGVVIHTNLGRSLLNREVLENLMDVTENYSNLEFDIDTGNRGSRYSHLESKITEITGAESAMVVNNNAAAVMLALSSIAKDREVIVSRGELIEIGGSFRIPDVMEESGAELVSVGTTNKTHIEDYKKAITEETGALLKVHTSNYKILGFTSDVDGEELVELRDEYNIPVIEDLGSGVLIDLEKYGLEYEPTVQESVKKDIDIITFSGDKLLGGPQAGIIVGKKKYIDMMKSNPLTRAFRIDKFTIAALESTLNYYLDEESAIKNIPTLNMLTTDIFKLEDRANRLKILIEDLDSEYISCNIVDEYSEVGGGSMPLEKLATKAVVIQLKNITTSSFEESLRNYKIPIITRVYRDEIYMDLRTIKDKELEIIRDAIEKSLIDLGRSE